MPSKLKASIDRVPTTKKVTCCDNGDVSVKRRNGGWATTRQSTPHTFAVGVNVMSTYDEALAACDAVTVTVTGAPLCSVKVSGMPENVFNVDATGLTARKNSPKSTGE